MSALETLVSNMTVAQLAEVAGLGVDEIVALVLTKAALHRSQSATKSQANRRKGPKPRAGVINTKEAAAGEVNTRTREGREAFDKAILEFLGGCEEPARASEVRKGVGGTAAQIRARLNHLIEETGQVAFEGRAAGTRYWVAK